MRFFNTQTKQSIYNNFIVEDKKWMHLTSSRELCMNVPKKRSEKRNLLLKTILANKMICSIKSC